MASDKEETFWLSIWKITSFVNIIVAICALLWFGKKTLVYNGDVKATDLILIVLASVTVVVGALGLVVGGFAVWGFVEIKRAAQDAARETARAEARILVPPLAAREAFNLQSGLTESNSIDSLTEALTEDKTRAGHDVEGKR